ncbi:serine/threonine-protein kinase pim-1-like isoform X1 [Sebastes umbrosus]|uniref:serine/threonine-protein kinase pim-1-like isoform X1 n=2 Tax=Sebastes umbrosus TaxID=72105 RepID=UPI00189FA274|nr:serine/threonine-protein kinase pim-1-like isoform X1 [Sebastes umbrosus]
MSSKSEQDSIPLSCVGDRDDKQISGSPNADVSGSPRVISRPADTCNDVQLNVSERKRRAGDDAVERPEKRLRCDLNNIMSEKNNRQSIANERGNDGAHVSEESSAVTEEEIIYQMATSANPRGSSDFENKYEELDPIGAGGFGSVYSGYRKDDYFPVAIKHIPSKDVRCQQVPCNGKDYHIILEVAFMLKTAGLPGSKGGSAIVCLLDWYRLDHEIVLVMERPYLSTNLLKYRLANGGSLDERDAKLILKQLVDAAIHMHSKGVFHRDIKLQNVLVQDNSGVPKVYVIDFGCSSFCQEMPYTHYWGTPAYAPPEWLNSRRYCSRPTTVWQLGMILLSLLVGHYPPQVSIQSDILTDDKLSADVKYLLHRCLATDPRQRITLEELQQSPSLQQTIPPPTQGYL